MPSTKEIRAKIRSVHNTRKITKAMEMVAASKMKKAQDRMRAARPYGNTIRNLIGHLADASTEAVHPFLRKVKEVNNIGLICVSTDKGLAGALNTNIQRQRSRLLEKLSLRTRTGTSFHSWWEWIVWKQADVRFLLIMECFLQMWLNMIS